MVNVVNTACGAPRNVWTANIAIEWLPYSNEWENKFGQTYKNWKWDNLSKIRPINLIVLAHSVCPYKKWWVKTLHRGLWIILYILSPWSCLTFVQGHFLSLISLTQCFLPPPDHILPAKFLPVRLPRAMPPTTRHWFSLAPKLVKT